MNLVAAMLAIAWQAAPGSSVTPASSLANATKFELSFDGARVSGCSVTATSGNAQIDRFVCDVARTCGDRFRQAERRSACIAAKREDLAKSLEKELKTP